MAKGINVEEFREQVINNIKQDVKKNGWELLGQKLYSDNMLDMYIYVVASKCSEYEYVCHIFNAETGGLGNGHYFSSYEAMREDFNNRTGRKYTLGRRVIKEVVQ